jgi:hypothetical protein
MTANTPVGVGKPPTPVDTVEVSSRPLRSYTHSRWLPSEMMICSGPSGCRDLGAAGASARSR